MGSKSTWDSSSSSGAAAATAGWSNTRIIGKIIYTDYIFAFEVAGLVLLVAIIAAIALTARHAKDSKRQNVGDQVKVRAQDRVRVVKMASEKTAATEAAEAAAAAKAAAAEAAAATAAAAPAKNG